jgi:LacI family transcriptional regulator
MVGIKDIAKQTGVSPTTVSRIANGKLRINSEKRKRILTMIQETGYVPNKAARAMVLRRSFTVGFVIPHSFNVFQHQLFSLVEEQLMSLGYQSLFFFVKADTGEKECLNRLKAEDLDGIVMFHEIKDPDFYKYLSQTKIPAVSTLDNSTAISTVKIDDRQAAFEAVSHLIRLGHRKINMISTNRFSFGTHRAEGYFLALKENNIPEDAERVVYEPQYTPESGAQGMKKLLLRNRDFSAVFAATDDLAVGVVRTLKDGGFRIPEDVSVVGFDDTETSSYVVPRLTTIRQPLEKLGKQTALALHGLISGIYSAASGTAEKSAESFLPHELIVRESTAPYKGS